MPRFKDPELKRTFMLETPIPRLVTSMALPSIASMIVSSLYNLADTAFVSQLGTSATSAVGVNSSIDQLIMMGGSLVATGAASYASRLLGAKQDQHANEVLSTSYFVALLLGCIVMGIGLVFQNSILTFLGANEEILPYSRQYCRYILLAAPFMSTSFVLNQCLRAEGSSTYSMVGMVSGAILNIGLDPIFIFGLGWGVAGASAATAISKLVSWSILMTPYLRRQTLLTIKLSQFRLRWGDIKEVCAMGSSSFFRTGLGTAANIMLNRLAVQYGTSALAAVSVSNRITMFMTSACLGFGQGFQPVAGYSWGAKRYDRVREAFRFSAKACIIAMVLVGGTMAIFSRSIIQLFTESDQEMVRIGVFSLRFQCLALPFHAYAIVVNMLCAGIGRALPAVFLSTSRQGLFFLPVLPVLEWIFGVWGVASINGVADILSLLLAVPVSHRILKDLKRREAADAAQTPIPQGA